MGAPGEAKALGIIIPHFRDERILRAIDSVRAFDDASAVSITVVDGGSDPELVGRIRGRLTADDILISEPDKGIFDALNKGLARTTSPFIGWIGADDYLSGMVKASEVIRQLQSCDLFIGDTAMVNGDRVVRRTHSAPARYQMGRFGLHNPHFSTFGRRELLAAEQFTLGLRGSDIDYFLRVFARRPRVLTTSRVATYQEEGGFSNSGYKAVLKTNRELISIYRTFLPLPAAALAVAVKLAYKLWSSAYYKLRTVRRPLPAGLRAI